MKNNKKLFIKYIIFLIHFIAGQTPAFSQNKDQSTKKNGQPAANKSTQTTKTETVQPTMQANQPNSKKNQTKAITTPAAKNDKVAPTAVKPTAPAAPVPAAPEVAPPAVTPTEPTPPATPIPGESAPAAPVPAAPEVAPPTVTPTEPTPPAAPKPGEVAPTAPVPAAPEVAPPAVTPAEPTVPAPVAPPAIEPAPPVPPVEPTPPTEEPAKKPIEKPIEKVLKIEPEKFITKEYVRPEFTMADKPITKAERKVVKKEIYEPDKPDVATTPESFDALILTEKKSPLAAKDVNLGESLEPWVGLDTEQKLLIHFENEELKDFLKFLEKNLKVTFILDDYIQPSRAEGLQPIGGTKVTFKSNIPMTLQETWDLGMTFLEMAGFSIVPTTLSRTYHITKSKPTANRDPLPTFIGTDPDLIVNNDAKIRYVYFAENTELDTLQKIIEPLKSNSAGDLIKFPDLRAIMITDKASNIKSLIKILEEIDQVGIPETLSIIHLKHADAKQVQDLWVALTGEEKQPFGFRPRKTPTVHYFTKETRVIGDAITNSLIILGKRENIRKLEEFIFRYIDKKTELPYSPLHIYQLRYIDADSITQILNQTITQFNANQQAVSEAAKFGGVRDENKFIAPWVKLTSEPSGNRVIINADYEDYLFIRDILDKLDVEQPQVALRVLILDVDITDLRQFGTQLRNKKDCCDGSGGTDSILGRNINFQYAGLNGFITRETPTPSGIGGGPPFVNGVNRLLGNLINLAGVPAGGVPLFTSGTTLVTLGRDIFGFWGLLRILQSITRVSVISNPFLVTTHKYKAEISVGETRRVVSANVVGQTTQQAFSDLDANLDVIITPQISYDDVVTMNIYIDISQFVTRTDFPTVLRKQISTEAIAANKEVIALGGLIRDNIIETETKVPILGDIPLLGWLFKNKSKTVQRMSLLILIAPEIIKPHEADAAREFTQSQITDAKENIYSMERPYERRDPIHRWLFFDTKIKEIGTIDKFVSRQSRYVSASQRERIAPLLALDEKNIKEKSKDNKTLLELVKNSNDNSKVHPGEVKV